MNTDHEVNKWGMFIELRVCRKKQNGHYSCSNFDGVKLLTWLLRSRGRDLTYIISYGCVTRLHGNSDIPDSICVDMHV